MRNKLQRWMRTILISSMGGWLLAAGCLNTIQQELDLLWSPEASLNYVHQSWLVKTFGPGILKFW